MLRIETKHLLWLTSSAVLAGWLGCGGRVVDEPAGAEPLRAAPRPGPRAQPPSSALPRAEPAPLPALAPAPAPVSPPDDAKGRQESECSCVSDGVANVLTSNCGQCHGPLAPVADSGGITFINDLDRLIAAGLLVPLNSAASPMCRQRRDRDRARRLELAVHGPSSAASEFFQQESRGGQIRTVQSLGERAIKAFQEHSALRRLALGMPVFRQAPCRSKLQ